MCSDVTDGFDAKPLAYRVSCPVIALEHNMGTTIVLCVGYFQAMPWYGIVYVGCFRGKQVGRSSRVYSTHACALLMRA